jgi:hypothetical protein
MSPSISTRERTISEQERSSTTVVRIRYTAARTGLARLAIPGRTVEIGDVIDVSPERAVSYLTAHATRSGSLVADFEPEETPEEEPAEPLPEVDEGPPARLRHREEPELSPTEPEAATIAEAPESGGTGAVIESGVAEADPGNENTGPAGGGT